MFNDINFYTSSYLQTQYLSETDKKYLSKYLCKYLLNLCT